MVDLNSSHWDWMTGVGISNAPTPDDKCLEECYCEFVKKWFTRHSDSTIEPGNTTLLVAELMSFSTAEIRSGTDQPSVLSKNT